MQTVKAAALSLLVPLIAFAHGGGDHVMGVVKSIDGKSITVETKDKKEVTLRLDGSTKFERAGASATAKDLSVGEKVVIHAEKSGDMLHAEMVKFGKSAGHGPHDSHPAGQHPDGGTH